MASPGTLLGWPNTRAHYPSLLERGLRKVFADEYPRWDTGLVEEVFNVTGSEKATETDAVVAELGQILPKPEGAGIIYDAMQEVWTKVYTHVTFALGVEFTMESIEDNLYINLMNRAGRALARAAAYTRIVQAMSIFNDLTATVYRANATNYTLLQTNQFLVNGSTWSNRPTNATGLSQAALEERLQAWTVGMVDQRGLIMRARPSVLMVGPSNEMLAKRLLGSPLRPQSGDNDINPVRDMGLRVFMNPHMTDDGRWFLLAPKGDTGLTQFDRIKAGISAGDDFDTGNLKKKVRARWSSGASNVWGVTGSPGS